jgi:hypothetical protein
MFPLGGCPLMSIFPFIKQFVCTNHTTGVFFAFGVKLTVTPVGIFTDE